jgi:hypothetical protein
MDTGKKKPECGMCTLKCVAIAYRRAPWFRLVREPMLIGMRLFSAFLNIQDEVSNYPFPTVACHDCIRFYKAVLLRRSGSFRWLNAMVSPVFQYFMTRMVTGEERKQARNYALAASAGTLEEKEINDWMKDLKAGL